MRVIAAAVPRVATIRKPRSCSCAAMPDRRRLVGVGHRQEHRAARSAAACPPPPAPSRTRSGSRRRRPSPRRSSASPGPSSASAPAKRSNGSTASLTETWSPAGSLGQVHRRELLAEHHAAGELGQRQPGRLGHERHRPRRARVGLDHVQVVAVDAVLDVDQPDDAERERERRASPRGSRRSISRAERVRRQHAGRVAGVDAGLLDVLHDAADPDVLAVADRVDVDLDRVLEEAVEEDLALAASRAAR